MLIEDGHITEADISDITSELLQKLVEKKKISKKKLKTAVIEAGKYVVLVSLGNPYVLTEFPQASALLAA